MHADISVPTKRCMLQGEWAIGTAVEQLNLLAGELALLLETDPRPSRVAIDLAEVTGMDACGCQLLALFAENLKASGITPELSSVPPEIREHIKLLGFTDALDDRGFAAKEQL